MYSREQRMKAIALYIKYDKSIADVIRELGYPSSNLLPRWYKAYLKEQETGVLWEKYSRLSQYTLDQKKIAVEHFLTHGRNISRTIRMLGKAITLGGLRNFFVQIAYNCLSSRVQYIQRMYLGLTLLPLQLGTPQYLL